MAEIFARRTGLAAAERELWWIDPDAAVAAELAAALNVSAGLALHQTNRGVALRDRLPRVAALFEAGLLSDLLVRTIVSRTYLIEDAAAMAAVDADLAERVTRWGALSVKKTEHAIDELVERHDPGAVRRTVSASAQETVVFGCPTDVAGVTTIWARLNSPDAALMEHNVEAMAHSVCDADPRSADQRRAHALAARANGTAFGCRCGDPDCSGGVPGDAPARNAVIYAVADEHTLDAATNPPAEAAAEPEPEPEPEPGPERRESPQARPKPAYRVRRRHHADRAVGCGGGARPDPAGAPSRRVLGTRTGLRAVTHAGRVCAVSRSHMPIPGLRQAGAGVRRRPHRGLSGGANPSVEPEVPVPFSPLAENVLERTRRLA